MINRYLLAHLVFFASLFSSCRQNNNCDKLPKRFTSYAEAISKIESSKFEIKEEVNTSKSSWIRGASFYSCDGNIGFFILQTTKQKYLYSNMPYDLWIEFKNAESFGKFYNDKIKHQFIFKLNN